MAQLVEHILGKDEVPGPNPGSSSKHPRSSFELRGFGFIYKTEKQGFLASPFLALFFFTIFRTDDILALKDPAKLTPKV